jgi:hypothetical protein
LSRLKKQKLEAAGSSGAVQALRMENDAPVVGPDATTANSRLVKLDVAASDWNRPLRVEREQSVNPVDSRVRNSEDCRTRQSPAQGSLSKNR